MTYSNQQNRGPPVPKQCFICRDNLPGSAPRMIEFRNEGFKPDGTPKPVMYEPNSNVKHIHYPRPTTPTQSPQQQAPPPPVQQPQQRNLPIDRIQESDRAQPDAPVQKPVTQQSPIAKTLENNPDGTPKSVTMECDVCKQKGIPGQMIYGDAVGFDTTIQKYVWMFFDHDPANPTSHKVIHAHRDKPIQKEVLIPAPPPVQQQSAIVPTMEQLQEALKTQMGFIKADRDKEQTAMKEHADKMLKATQSILATNEMYMKAMIRIINYKLNQLFNLQAAQFFTLHQGIAYEEKLNQEIEKVNANANKHRELEFAEDAVIFDALNIYDVREAAVPTTADTLVKRDSPITMRKNLKEDLENFNKTPQKSTPPPDIPTEAAPTPGLCSNCGVQVADINTHTCPEIRQESFKPTQEELAQIQAEEDETPDINPDDRVYRI